MSVEGGAAHNEPEVFISYRRLDNRPPSGSRNRHGFVNYLLRQVRSRLEEDGVPDAILWLDRSQIEPGDIWSDKILNALKRAELFVAILSKNYIRSSWCAKELHTNLLRNDLIEQFNQNAVSRRSHLSDGGPSDLWPTKCNPFSVERSRLV